MVVFLYPCCFFALLRVWSVSPGETQRAGVQYLFFIIGAIGIAENVEADDFMHLLAWVCFLAATASLVLLVVSPANVFGGDGDFRGVFSQKNPLGQAMSMGALGQYPWTSVGKRRRLYNIVTLFLTIILTIKSESATSMLTISLFVSLGYCDKVFPEGGTARAAAIGGIVILLPATVIAAFNLDSLLSMLGKDPTLTGRTDIWGYVIPDIYQRPLLGWGYQAFWSTDNPAAWAISNALHWWVPQAHNGMLEILPKRWTYRCRLVHLSVGTNSPVISGMHADVRKCNGYNMLVNVRRGCSGWRQRSGPPLYWFHNFHLLHYWFLLRASDINSTTANLQASC